MQRPSSSQRVWTLWRGLRGMDLDSPGSDCARYKSPFLHTETSNQDPPATRGLSGFTPAWAHSLGMSMVRCQGSQVASPYSAHHCSEGEPFRAGSSAGTCTHRLLLDDGGWRPQPFKPRIIPAWTFFVWETLKISKPNHLRCTPPLNLKFC